MLLLDRYHHISFDLDGTLVHTLPVYRYSVVPRVVKLLGGRAPEEHFVDKFWFEANRDTVINDIFGIEPNLFWETFRQIDIPEERGRNTYAYNDVETALRRLKSIGKMTSIITGAPHWVAQMEIGKLNSAPYDFCLSIIDSGFNTKPNPDSFNFALKKMGVNAKETLYIGNSNEDAYYAQNAGVDFLYLERKEHEFDLRNCAIGTIHTLNDLFHLPQDVSR